LLQKNHTTSPYHAFGMEMPGRKWTASNYRYSHNGHEKEEEIFSGAQSAEFWMYDSRIGRRWEMDPVVKPYESPYMAFSGNPIALADPKGLDGESRAYKKAEKVKGTVVKTGEGKFEVHSASMYEMEMPDGTKAMGFEKSIEKFQDNFFDKIGHALAKAGRNIDNWLGKYKGGALDGSEWAGPDGVKQFDAGVRLKAGAGGMFENTTEAKVTSRHANYSEFKIDNTTSANWQIGEAGKLISPFKKTEEGKFFDATVEAFVNVSITDKKSGDFSISQSVPLGGEGAYIRINTVYNVKTNSIRVQSVELGYSPNPKSSVETSISAELINVDLKKGKATSIGQ
jgi:RHS repeat-associated protein